MAEINLCNDCPKVATHMIADTALCEEHYQITMGELESKEDSAQHED